MSDGEDEDAVNEVKTRKMKQPKKAPQPKKQAQNKRKPANDLDDNQTGFTTTVKSRNKLIGEVHNAALFGDEDDDIVDRSRELEVAADFDDEELDLGF